MSFAFRISPRAESQIRTAVRWWAINRTKAPSLLQDELNTAFGLIEELPHAGESVVQSRIRDLRRLLLGGSQYHLYYNGVGRGRLGGGSGTVAYQQGKRT